MWRGIFGHSRGRSMEENFQTGYRSRSSSFWERDNLGRSACKIRGELSKIGYEILAARIKPVNGAMAFCGHPDNRLETLAKRGYITLFDSHTRRTFYNSNSLRGRRSTIKPICHVLEPFSTVKVTILLRPH